MQFKDKYITPNWDVKSNVKAFTTLKGLDFSLVNNIREELLKSFFHELEVSYNDIPWLQQVHGTKALNADLMESNSIKKNNFDTIEADAIFTNKSRMVCSVLTADCLPIFVTNKNGDVAAAIHAGWRGLVNGIIENTVNAMNIKSTDLVVWLGPAIGKEKFEIGQEVKEIFINNARDKNLVTSSIVPKIDLKNNVKDYVKNEPRMDFKFDAKMNQIDSVTESTKQIESTDKYFADLHLLAKDRLLYLNVPNKQIYASNYCTYTDENKFYSYRRDKTTSRMISLIVLN